MRLKENQAAIDFIMQDFTGKTIRLEDYKGKKILLTFYRFATCPHSNFRLNHVIEMFPDLRAKGLAVIGVFESANKQYINTYIGGHNPPFPIITDPDKKLYTPYGLETSVFGLAKSMFQLKKLFQSIIVKKYKMMPTKIDSTMHRMPADFLIDENMMIKKVHYGSDIGDHISDKDVYEFINN